MKYKYVSWQKDKNKYKGVITFDGKAHHVGYSKDNPIELSEKAQKLKKEKRLEDTLAICGKGEIFKDVPECKGTLQISNKGRVKAIGPQRFGILPIETDRFMYRVGKKIFTGAYL